MTELTAQQRASKKQAEKRKSQPKLTGRVITQELRDLLDEMSKIYGSENAAITQGLLKIKNGVSKNKVY